MVIPRGIIGHRALRQVRTRLFWSFFPSGFLQMIYLIFPMKGSLNLPSPVKKHRSLTLPLIFKWLGLFLGPSQENSLQIEVLFLVNDWFLLDGFSWGTCGSFYSLILGDFFAPFQKKARPDIWKMRSWQKFWMPHECGLFHFLVIRRLMWVSGPLKWP